MNFLETLAEDLRDYETSQERRRLKVERPQRPGLGSDQLQVLSLIRTEALRVAALLAASTSLANDATSLNDRRNPAPIQVFLPSFPPAMETRMASLSDDEVCFELYQLWLAAIAKLAFARDVSAMRAAEAGHQGKRPIFHADVIADAWCRACLVLCDFIHAVARLMDVHGIKVRPPHEAHCVALLKAAAAGGSPCLNSDGSFSLPGWAERRREKRQELLLPVRIRLGAQTYPATLENLSARGAQIVAGFMIPSGARVDVHLAGDRSLTATVSWSNAERAGLLFLEPVAEQDPLWSMTRRQT